MLNSKTKEANMAKRHLMIPGDWESIFGRLQELVLANSGEDDFEEIFKLIVAKLFSEIFNRNDLLFQKKDNPDETLAAINQILIAANDVWKGIIKGQVRSRLTPEHLDVCVEALENHSLLETNLEVLDGAFEYLVTKASKGSKGQYFTPRHVVECCIRILNPGTNEIVVDPACGSGGFLVHVFNHVNNKKVDIKEYCQGNIWGFDFDSRAIQVAKALMLIAGGGNTNLFQLNSLLLQDLNHKLFQEFDDNGIPRMTIEDVMRSRFSKFKGFDIVVTNPPFAGEIREKHLIESYEVCQNNRKIERDVLFLERCISLLKPGGRIAIVLPTNKFGSPSWQYLREWLFRKLRIVAVLGLPRNTFLPHTHQKAGILFGIKRNSIPKGLIREDILFIVSEHAGKNLKGQIISKKNSDLSQPMWVRAKHDMDEAVDKFDEFIRKQNIIWGNE